MPAPAPAPATPQEATPARASLPIPLTSLIGREAELAQLIDCLRRGRLVTLTGAGGLGKTRLAIEAAHSLSAAFPDGAWFVDLSAVSDPANVPQAVGNVLGVRAAQGGTLTEALIAWLISRRLLLVLDNGEHLIDACAQLVRHLAGHCPGLHLLLTSRQALRMTGEVVHQLEPLAVPALDTVAPEAISPCEAAAYPAVRLFTERAVAVRPHFALSPLSLPAVVEICRRLDGIPLALELAAARMNTLSAEQIAGYLQQRFRLLTGGDRTAPPRQQSLLALLDWSYDLLTPEEASLFAALSVFAGGWTADAAAAVCNAPDSRDASLDTLDLLDSLVAKSLVLARIGPDGNSRYYLLETLREYAAERLAERGLTDQMRQRHRHWCIEFAESANREMGGAGQVAALRSMETENDNFRQALRLTAPGTDRLRLAAALFWHWYVHGHYAEGRAWLERTLPEAPEASDVLRFKALKGIGDLCWAQGDMESARRSHLKSLEQRRLEDDPRAVAIALNSLGLVTHHQGDSATAAGYYRQSLAILRELGDPNLTGSVLGNLAIVLPHIGGEDEAADLLQEAESIFRESGNRRGLVNTHHTLGLLAKRQGDYVLARRYMEAARDGDRELQDVKGEATALDNLGEVALLERDLPLAERYFQEALTVFQRIGAKRSVAATLSLLGELALTRGGLDEADKRLRESLSLQRSVGDRLGILESLRRMAHREQASGRLDRAAHLLAAVQTEQERLKVPIPSNRCREYAAAIATVRASLGDEAFAARWTDGAAMDLESAVAYLGITT